MEQVSFFDKIKIDRREKFTGDIVADAKKIFKQLENLKLEVKIEIINEIRRDLHNYSPFNSEPVDFIEWVNVKEVHANDYNPNSVAPPEMELLRHSINHDGYTQPVVTWKDSEITREVIDGFHRTRVCKECEDVNKRVNGYLPVVTIKENCKDRNDRISSTIRHNRARGKHQVDSMSDIVIELKKRNWSDKRIGKELGMDEDEILRLCQITGLTEVFSDENFSKAWDIGIFDDDDFGLVEDIDEYVVEVEHKDPNRIFHPWEKWECQKAGFYRLVPPKGMSRDEATEKYAEFLRDTDLFDKVLSKLIKEWKYSCEHYLSNENMNRIAWLGQAAMCYEYKVPSQFRSGYNLLSENEKVKADAVALKYLNIWLKDNGRDEVTEDSCQSKTVANLY